MSNTILLSEKEIDYLNIQSELGKGENSIVMDYSTMEWIREVSRTGHWEAPAVLLYNGPTTYYLKYVNRGLRDG